MTIADGEMILTAGPSVTERELEYVCDAAATGWNSHHSDYLRRFEAAMAEYLGIRYAVATSSCTGALHLGLLALGVGPGDEVLVPEITWVATASAVRYTGAVPVCVEVHPETWVMDPEAMERSIGPRTKAVIPVHLFGQPADMPAIVAIARARGLKIFEDAAPAIGAKIGPKCVGSFGDAAAISFQGAKLLVTGEGGMFLTDDTALHDRVRVLNDHARDPAHPLAAREVGYKYKMSNLQAAFGLAQTERVEELIDKKRRIFGWYRERLNDLPQLQLNVERPNTRNIYWMSSLVLDASLDMTRDDFCTHLRARNIDSRPFFPPLSSLPMFRGNGPDNPVARHLGSRGVNLPSGHDRTEEEIDYICGAVRAILGSPVRARSTTTTSWLDRRARVRASLRALKQGEAPPRTDPSLTFGVSDGTTASLVPIDRAALTRPDDVHRLRAWRDAAQKWYPTQFAVTFESTRRWLERGVLDEPDRLLFFVVGADGTKFGHVGLFRFDYQRNFCEIDNVLRGVPEAPAGIMGGACATLIDWCWHELALDSLCLRVVSDNQRALALYRRLGFEETLRVPLRPLSKVSGGAKSVSWIRAFGDPYYEPTRYEVTMKIRRSDWHGRPATFAERA